MIELTKEEKELILSLLAQVKISALQPDAAEMAKICQTIAKKLTEDQASSE